MRRIVQLAAPDARSAISGAVASGWVVASFVGAVLFLLAMAPAAVERLFGGWDPRALPGGVASLGVALAGWAALTGLLEVVKRRFTARASRLVAFGVLAVALSAIGFLHLRSSVRFREVLGGLPLDASVVQLVVAVGAGVSAAAASWLLLISANAVHVRASSRMVRSLVTGTAVIAVGFAVAAMALPSGVNAVFAQEAWLLFATMAGFGAMSLRIVQWTGENGGREAGRSSVWSPKVDLPLILLPLVPIVRYLVVNRSDLAFPVAIAVAGLFAVAVAVLVMMVPAAFGRHADARVLRAFLSGWLFVLLNMASMSNDHAWYMEGSFWLQILILLAAIAVVLLFTLASGQALAWIVVVLLGLEVGNALFATPGSSSLRSAEGGESAAARGAEDVGPLTGRPDIFLLVYDSYANRETMDAYGFDNADHMELLADEGFSVYDGIYSVEHHSLSSMSRVLEATTTIDRDPKQITGGDSYVTQVLDSAGYSTAGVFYSDYFFKPGTPTYDFRLPDAEVDSLSMGIRPLTTGILRGEFRAEASFNEVDYEEFLATKRRVLSTPGDDPRFMYSHSPRPGHSQNSGKCLPDEAERYFDGILVANDEMRWDIQAANQNTRDAIVIITADHGPYLTKNCHSLHGYDAEDITRLDIQDRYGTFLAIRWPESLDVDRRVQVLQEVFPLVFSVLSEDPEIWDERRVEPVTTGSGIVAGVTVVDGIIRGGADDGEPLFVGR